jgi:hypothetical protein
MGKLAEVSRSPAHEIDGDNASQGEMQLRRVG